MSRESTDKNERGKKCGVRSRAICSQLCYEEDTREPELASRNRTSPVINIMHRRLYTRGISISPDVVRAKYPLRRTSLSNRTRLDHPREAFFTIFIVIMPIISSSGERGSSPFE